MFYPCLRVLARCLIMSGTSSVNNNSDLFPSVAPPLGLPSTVSFLAFSFCVSISPPIHLATTLPPLGHFLIPSAHIQVLPSSIKPHSSNHCLLIPSTPNLSPSSYPLSTPIQPLHPAAFPVYCLCLMVYVLHRVSVIH